MKYISIVVGVMALALSGQVAAVSSFVSNGNDSGNGSLRAALDSGANKIRISPSVETIKITQPLTYTETRSLKLSGSGQVIDATGLISGDDIFSVTNGANLNMSDLTLIGPDADVNEDSSNPQGGKGIFVAVPITRTGIVRVTLEDVTVTRVGHHGIHISDCSLGDDCGSGSGGAGDGSPASIFVKVDNVMVNKVGFGRADADGLRVDDRGEGGIYFRAIDSTFINVGADGVELDEGNNGDVIARVRRTVFDSNGEYCLLVANFEGSPCDDDGDRDVDDGFDIDEAGAGSLYADIVDTKVTNNFDEGLDFDEEDGNGIEARIVNVLATGNEDEGIKMSEEGEGNLIAELVRVTTVDNNGSKEGIELEEADAGDVEVLVRKSNMIGAGDEELKLEQDDAGTGSVSVFNSSVVLDLDNVTEL
jgi:hypothetical protein